MIGVPECNRAACLFKCGFEGADVGDTRIWERADFGEGVFARRDPVVQKARVIDEERGHAEAC